MSRSPRDRFSGRRVMVTGGMGFIGSNLSHALAAAGADVLVVDSLVPGCGGNRHNLRGIEDRVQVAEVDIGDAGAFPGLVRGRECIFNLAGQVSHIDSMTNPLGDLDSNSRAHLVLIEACRRESPAAKVVYAATRQAYGRPRALPVAEDHPQRPADFNGIHKMAGEFHHRILGRIHGIRTCCLRLTNTFGPRQLMKHDRQGFAPVFIRRAMDGERIPLYGGGRQLRDLNYVDDVVDAFLTAMDSPAADGEVLNLGSGEAVSLADFASMAIEVAGKGSVETVPFPEERRRIDIGSYIADISKIRTRLGWEPKIGLREGIERTVRFYEEHRDAYWP